MADLDKIQQVVGRADLLLDMGGAVKMGGNLTASDLLIEAPDLLAEKVKGRRKAGSPEAIAGAYVKALRSLVDLNETLKKHDSSHYEGFKMDGDSGAASAGDRFKSTALVARPPGNKAKNAHTQTGQQRPPLFGETEIIMVPIGKVEVNAAPIMKAMFAVAALAISYFPLLVFLAISWWLGIFVYTLAVTPGLWVDIGMSFLKSFPRYIGFVGTEVIVRTKWHIEDFIYRIAGLKTPSNSEMSPDLGFWYTYPQLGSTPDPNNHPEPREPIVFAWFFIFMAIWSMYTIAVYLHFCRRVGNGV